MKKRLGLIILLLGGLGVFFYVRYTGEAHQPWRERFSRILSRAAEVLEGTETPLDEARVSGVGTLEFQEYRITSKNPGYLEAVSFDEGDSVEKGQLLAQVERKDLLAKKRQNQAALDEAKALLKDMEAGARPEEIEKIRARLEGVRARYAQAKKDVERYRTLEKDQVVPLRKLEELRTALDTIESEEKALEAELLVMRLGARKERVQAQKERIRALEAAADITGSLLEDSRIRAPHGGIVLIKSFEPGEYVAPGGVLGVIGDPRDCWLRFYLPSTQLGLVRWGQKARMRVDSFPDRVFSGEVRDIAAQAEFTPRESLSSHERSNLSFRIKVRFPNEEALLKPGMPGEVELLP